MTAIFGIDYGGASSGIVHQDRLVLAGGGGVPDVVAASKTGDWTDFDTGGSDADASDGFWFQQVSARGNRFHAMLQQQGLLIFGDVGESAIPPGPFTAASVEVRENSWIGSDTGRTPIIAGNLVVFLQRGGEDIRGIVWNEQQLKYIAPSLLVLSGNVFERARDMTYQPSAGRRGDTVYVVDDDGTMAVLLLRVGEETPSWSRWNTQGRIVGAAAPLGRAVFLVERNGVMGIETLADEAGDELDCQVTLTAGDTLPDWMAGLEGGRDPDRPLRARKVEPEARARFDRDEEFEVAAGAAPFEIEAGDTYEVGLRYERIIETLQYVRRAQTGNSARMNPMRVLECAVDFVFPATDVVAQEGPVANRAARDWLRSARMEVVPYTRNRKRPRPLRASPSVMRSAVGGDESGRSIVKAQYPARLGWRDRIAVELRSEDHYEVAGIAYRVSA